MDEQKLDVTAQQPDAALHAQTEEITNEALPEALLEQQAAQAELSQAIEASAEELQPEQAEQTTQPERVTVVDIRFRNNAKTYFFDPGELRPVSGDHVIIETARGDEYGICAGACHEVKASEIVPPLRKVLRMATAQDERVNRDNQEKEKRAFEVCQQKIADHKLEMQLVSAEVAFDGSKILFFFTAEGRVDFRELVKDLASAFRTRIELRQIGVRDEAKMIGGLGICGRPFCCAQFMDEFLPVSIKMAKTQNLSLNPTKISGTCGRLMCCLKYEQDAYEDAIKRLPKNDSFVLTPDGTGNVSDVNVLKETVNVRLDDRTDGPRCYHNCEVCVLRNGKGSREGIAVPDKRPERYVEPLAEEELPTITLLSDFDPDAAAESEKKRGRRSRSRRRSDGEKRTAEKPAAPAEKAPRSDAPAEGGKPRREGGDRRRRSGRRGGNGGANAAGSTGAPAPKAVKPAGDDQGTVSGEKKRSRHRPRRRSGGNKPNGGTEA